MKLDENYCYNLKLAANLIRKGSYMIDFDRKVSGSPEHTKLIEILADLDNVLGQIIKKQGTKLDEISEEDLETFLADLAFFVS